VFQVGLGLALAVFYTQNFPGSRWMRGLYLIAWTIPTIVSGAIFKWLFEEKGVINFVLDSLGLIDVTQNPVLWTSEAVTALASVIVANIWLGLPFNLTLLVAALEGVPREIYEAGSLDGVVGWRKFWWLTLPMIRPALLSVLILGLIYTFKVFDLMYIITGGGPLGASEVVSTLAFRKLFDQYLYGEGAAILNGACSAPFFGCPVFVRTRVKRPSIPLANIPVLITKSGASVRSSTRFSVCTCGCANASKVMSKPSCKKRARRVHHRCGHCSSSFQKMP
jgi:multiple sugar transport system permease protein